MAEKMRRFLGDQFSPALRHVGGYLGRAHQPEVGRAEIGANEERATCVIDVVNDASPTRLNEH